MRALAAALLLAALPTAAFAAAMPQQMVVVVFAQVIFGVIGIIYFLVSVFCVILWWNEQRTAPKTASLERASYFFLGGCCLYSGTFMKGLLWGYLAYPDTITISGALFIAIVVAVPFGGLVLPFLVRWTKKPK